MALVCANGHPAVPGERFCATCGAAVAEVAVVAPPGPAPRVSAPIPRIGWIVGLALVAAVGLTAVWLSRDDGTGSVVATNATPAPTTISDVDIPSPPILRPDGIGNSVFGDSVTGVVADVSLSLGDPTSRETFDCLGSLGFETVEWSPLTLYFEAGTGLVGYDYGVVYPDATYRASDDPLALAASPDGSTLLHLGMTRAAVQGAVPGSEFFEGAADWPHVEDALYGEPVLVVSARQDIDERLIASLWATPEGNAPSDRVLQFSAGFGCRD